MFFNVFLDLFWIFFEYVVYDFSYFLVFVYVILGGVLDCYKNLKVILFLKSDVRDLNIWYVLVVWDICDELLVWVGGCESKMWWW